MLSILLYVYHLFCDWIKMFLKQRTIFMTKDVFKSLSCIWSDFFEANLQIFFLRPIFGFFRPIFDFFEAKCRDFFINVSDFFFALHF